MARFIGALVMQSVADRHGADRLWRRAISAGSWSASALVLAVYLDNLYREQTEVRSAKHMANTGSTPLVELRDISIAFGRRQGGGPCDSIDLHPGEVVGLSGPQRRREIDADQDACRGPIRADAGRNPRSRANRPRFQQSRATPGTHNIETIYQTLALGRQPRTRPANLFLGARAR